MNMVYVNKGKSFQYNVQLGTKSIIEYSDASKNDLSSLPDIDIPVVPDEDDEPDPSPGPAPEPEPEPEPTPTPEPEPEPEKEDDKKIVIESTCTAKVQKANGDHPQRHVTTSTSGICLTKWHTNFNLCMNYAKKQGIPIFLVWSEGGACGHCCVLHSALQSKTFVNFMNKTKIVWCYMIISDKDAHMYSKAQEFTRGKGGGNLKEWRAKDKTKLWTGYPFVCLYWYNTRAKKPTISIDVTATGDQVDGYKDGAAGAKNVINWIKDKTKNVKKKGYDMSTATFTLT